MHMNAMMCIDGLFEQVAFLSLTYSIKSFRKHRHMIAWSWIQPCVIPAQVPAPVYPVPCLCVCACVCHSVWPLSNSILWTWTNVRHWVLARPRRKPQAFCPTSDKWDEASRDSFYQWRQLLKFFTNKLQRVENTSAFDFYLAQEIWNFSCVW